MKILTQEDISNILGRNNEQRRWHNLNKYYASNDESKEPHSPIVAIRMGEQLEEEYWLCSRFDGQYYQHLSQGSEADFAPYSKLEFELVKYLKKEKKPNPNRITVGQILSNQGIRDVYKFLHENQNNHYVTVDYTDCPDHNPKNYNKIIQEILCVDHESDNRKETINKILEQIIENAHSKTDTFSRKTLEIIGEILGRECGNIALQFLCYDGVYLVGDFFTKIQFILEEKENERFINAFIQKGRMEKYMKKIPVYLETIKNF
ncbi:MAG: glucokinase [Crocosphaera sp.]|nr:glucokinase [Crocosphaera sp.]